MAMNPRFSSLRCVVVLAYCAFLFVLPLFALQNTPDFNSAAAAAAAARESGKRDQAISWYQKAVALNSTWTEGWWYLGTLSYDGDRFTDAARAMEKVTDLSPQLGAAWSFLGLSEYELKNYSAAQTHLEKGIAVGNADDPEVNRVAKFHLALLLIRSHNFAQARKLLVPQFVSPPVAEQVRTALGLLLLRVGMVGQEIDPSRDAIVSAAGDLQLQLLAGKKVDGLAAIETIVAENLDKPVAHEILARCYDAMQNSAAAAKERAAAEALLPKPSAASERDAQLTAFLARGGAGIAAATNSGWTTGAMDSFEALAQQAASAQQSGNPSAAIPLYEKALQVRPDWDEGRWSLAMLYYSTRQFPAATGALKVWLEKNPNSGTGWGVLGLSEFETGDYENSLIHLQRGDELGLGASPDSLRIARYHLAILLNRKSEFGRANRILSAEAGPGALADETAFALGMAFLRIPRLPAEVPEAQRPLVQRTGEAAMLLAGSKYDLALPKMKELIRDYPTVPFLHYVYGSALSSLSMFEEAVVQFEAEARISQQSELPWIELASVHLQRHELVGAMAPAKRAVELAPSSAAAHYALGRVHLELGQTDSAVRELQQAATLSPGSAEVHFQLARAYARQNLPEKASAERAIFARLNVAAERARSSTGSQSYGELQPTPGVAAGEPDAPSPPEKP